MASEPPVTIARGGGLLFIAEMHLQPHPASPPSPVQTIQVLATRLGGNQLSLVFDVAGDIGQFRLPSGSRNGRRDGLWRHTCFEAFVRCGQAKGYFEFNLSPSGDWAAYRFDEYRDGCRDAEIPPPAIVSHATSDRLGLVAGIELGAMAELVAGETWQVAISAVIEETDGNKSYWALAHPPKGPPDFHHPDCFVLELPPAGEA